jgi:hypothetical protein
MHHSFSGTTCIARVNDASQFLWHNLQRHHRFPGMALKCRLTWSNNVLEECAALWQPFARRDGPNLLCFGNIAIWLDTSSTIQHCWSIHFCLQPRPPYTRRRRSKTQVQDILQEIFHIELFHANHEHGGSQSNPLVPVPSGSMPSGMALKCWLTWSKNILEECAEPWQTLLSAMDPSYCVLVNPIRFFLKPRPPSRRRRRQV